MYRGAPEPGGLASPLVVFERSEEHLVAGSLLLAGGATDRHEITTPDPGAAHRACGAPKPRSQTR